MVDCDATEPFFEDGCIIIEDFSQDFSLCLYHNTAFRPLGE